MGALADANHIAGAAVFRINRAEDMIEQSPFVKIGVVRIGPEREQSARHFQHVIDIAGFGSATVDHVGEFIRLAEIFITAMAACDKGVMLGYTIPKE